MLPAGQTLSWERVQFFLCWSAREVVLQDDRCTAQLLRRCVVCGWGREEDVGISEIVQGPVSLYAAERRVDEDQWAHPKQEAGFVLIQVETVTLVCGVASSADIVGQSPATDVLHEEAQVRVREHQLVCVDDVDMSLP